MYIKAAIAFFLCLTTINTTAQNNLDAAAKMAREGKFNEAIKAYTDILVTNEADIAARLGRGFTCLWKHDFANARADFNKVLTAEPANSEAQKGLAYAALWGGDYKKAILAFDKLVEKYPDNKEYFIARGQAQLNAGLLAEARQSFEKAKQLDPADKEAQQLITAVRNKPTRFDIDIIGGFSSAGSASTGGLRLLQISSQVSPKAQLSVKYDNSLSIDNLGLILRNQSIPYYAGAVLYKWNNKTMTKFEGGARSFKDAKPGETSSETQFSLEQIVFLKNNGALNAGASLISPNAGTSAYLLLAGYRQPFGSKITGGISYFYANRNVMNTTENRFLADADFFLPKGNTLSAGFYYGKSDSDSKALTGNIYGGFLRGYFPISNMLGLHLGLAAEKNFLQDLININGGIRFRLEK